MVKAVIFDLDGLLIDSEIMSYKIYQEILHSFGHELSLKEYSMKYCGKTELQNVSNLIDTYHLDWSVEEALNNVLKREASYIAHGLNLKPDAKELLIFLKEKGYKTIIATSSLEERTLTILKPHGITQYFDGFVYGNEVEKGKPHPDIFLKACEKIVEKPEDCLVLEDSEAGIQAAYAANIPVICVPDMKMPAQHILHMTKAVVNSLGNVKGYL